MLKKIFLLATSSVAAAMSFASFTHVVYAAETHLSGTYTQDLVLTKEKSPYILTGSVFVNGGKLIIEPGVTVKNSPKMPTGRTIQINNGAVKMNGTETDRIFIQDVSQFVTFNSDVEMSHVEATMAGQFQFNWSRVSVASTSIGNWNGAGISIWGSTVDIKSSRIESDGAPAIHITPNPPQGVASVAVRDSILITKNGIVVFNMTQTPVSAEGNWWGTSLGPKSLHGPVQTTPWLTSEPGIAKLPTQCCSNVLFVPGLQASRLYVDDGRVNKLWEPGSNSDVDKLFLDSSGKSIDPNVYAGEVIGKAYGLKKVYDSFLTLLNDLKKDGTISDWGQYGYDWRKPIADIVRGEEKRATTSESLLSVFETLASTSQTGKVTIVAHSNGGLVTRLFINELLELGKEHLIDRVISVAVPFLGTPQAILGLLHGSDQSIGHGLLLKESTARELGKNMPSAYSLLPSSEFFSKALTPAVAFASTTVDGINDGSYPMEIKSYDELVGLIADSHNVRPDPARLDTDRPIRGNKLLLDGARVLHNLLDPLALPLSITRWTIAGYNKLTASGIEYFNKKECSILLFGTLCKIGLGHRATTTTQGDGTVIYPSAAHDADVLASVDLSFDSQLYNRDFNHANILESPTVIAALRNYLSKKNAFQTSPTDLGPIDFDEVLINKYLKISTHSPVKLHIYDALGRHVGPSVITEGAISDDVVSGYDLEIPGSSYSRTRDNGDTYITVPLSTKPYSVVVEGNGMGLFSMNIERYIGLQIQDSAQYANIPVTPLMIATTTISTTTQAGRIILASSTRLSIDMEGDGTPDATLASGEAVDPFLFSKSLKKILEIIGASDPRAKSLVVRIERLITLAEKGRLKEVSKQANSLLKPIDHMHLGDLSATEREALIKIIEGFILQYE